MSNPRVQVGQKSDPSKQPQPFKKDSASTFSEDEIRTRAYQVYESGDRTGNHADEDWSQAETELMELVGGKWPEEVSRSEFQSSRLYPERSRGHAVVVHL